MTLSRPSTRFIGLPSTRGESWRAHALAVTAVSARTIARRASSILKVLCVSFRAAKAASRPRGKRCLAGIGSSQQCFRLGARQGLCATPPSAMRAVLILPSGSRSSSRRHAHQRKRVARPIAHLQIVRARIGRACWQIDGGDQFVRRQIGVRSGVSPGSRWKSLNGNLALALRTAHPHRPPPARPSPRTCRWDAWRCTVRSARGWRACGCSLSAHRTRCRACACCRRKIGVVKIRSSGCAEAGCRRWLRGCAAAGSRRRGTPR